MGSFSGTLSSTTNYTHSYYFWVVNGSTIANATSVVVNISGWSSSALDPDLYLFDNLGNLVARSASRGTTVESLKFKYLNSTAFKAFEIRLYGNPTSLIGYNGVVAFNTIEAVNVSNTAQIVSEINLATRNVTGVANHTIQLRNNGSLIMNNVAESSELFLVRRFSGTQAQNFTFFAPDSSVISRLKASAFWTGASNYTISVFDNIGNNYSSNNKSAFANFTGVPREEFIETTNLPSSAGFWRVEIKNNTVNPDAYNVVVLMTVNATPWITTNFTTTTFNQSSTGIANSSQNTVITFRVPNGTIDGTYEGNITYTASTGAALSIPTRASVTTPVLIVNNTLSSQTIQITKNYGDTTNMTFTFFVNNTGSLGTTLNMTLNSTFFFCMSGSCSTNHVINFTYNTTSFLAASGVAGNNASITATAIINNTMPKGLYTAWIFFNTSNATNPELSANPYSSFNMTLSINLTDALDVRLIGFTDDDGDIVLGNSSALQRNVTFKVRVFTINGTDPPIEITDLTAGNFSTFFLQHTNTTVAEGRIPVSGTLDTQNTTFPIYSGSQYNLKANVTSGWLGGVYNVNLQMPSIKSNQLNSSATFAGAASNGTMYLNSSGLLMTSNSTGCSFGGHCGSGAITLSPSDTSNVFVNVSNLGLTTETGATVTFSESCSSFSVAEVSGASTGCASATAGNPWTVTVNGQTNACIVTFKITANSSGSSSTCTGNIVGSPTGRFFTSSPINITVTFNGNGSSSSESSSTSSSGSTSATTTTSESSAAAKYLSISKWTSIIEVGQGKSGTSAVTVKNTNDTVAQTVTVSVTDLNDTITTSVSPASFGLDPDESTEFTVTFNVPDTADVDDYTGKFQASSSKDTVKQDFNLHVLPGEAAKKTINETFLALKKEVLDLWREINATRFGGINVTLTEEQFSQLKAKLDEAEAQLALGTDQGYFAASQLFEEIRNLLNTARSQLKIDKGGGFVFPVDPLYIGIGVGVAAIGFLVYLFLPTKGGAGRFKIGKQAAGSAAGKVSDAASNVKEATSDQLAKLKEKFKLKREFKYKYQE